MKRIVRGCCAAAVSLCVGSFAASAQEYDGAVFFGDSLSDDGSNLARVSNGRVYTEYLPGLIGVGDADVDNRAFAGAFTSQQEVSPGVFSGNTVPLAFLVDTDVLNQISDYLTASGGAAQAGTAYTVFGGGNNGFLADTNATGLADPNGFVQGRGQASALDVINGSRQLVNAGAATVIVPNLPDLGSVAELSGGSPDPEAVRRARLSLFTSTHNTALSAGAGALAQSTGADIVLVDFETIFADTQANPAKYGLINATDACTSTPSCAAGTVAQQNRFLFWDSIHPTTGTHSVMAAVIADTLTAPFTLYGPGEALRQASDSIRLRLAGLPLGSADGRDWFIFADGGYFDLEREAGGSALGYDLVGRDAVAGVGTALNDRWSVAGYGSWSGVNGSYLMRPAGFDVDAFQLGAFTEGALPQGLRLRVDAALGLAEIDSERDTGVAGQIARGSFDATTVSALVRLSRPFDLGFATVTPEGAVGYFRADLDDYSESGATGLDLQVADRDADAVYGELGARLERAFEMGAYGLTVTPRASVLYRADLDGFDQDVRASLVTIPDVVRSYSVDDPIDGAARFEAGVRVSSGGFDVDLSAAALSSDDTNDAYFFGGRIAAAF